MYSNKSNNLFHESIIIMLTYEYVRFGVYHKTSRQGYAPT